MKWLIHSPKLMNSSKKCLLGLSLCALMLSACNSVTGNYEKGEPITLDQVKLINADAANDGKRFSIVGYGYIPGDITLDGAAQIEIYTEPAGAGDYIIALPIYFGEGKNDFYIPDEFGDEDLVLYDNDGQAIAYNEAAEFSFEVDLQTDRERMTLGDQLVYFGAPEKVRIDRVE